VAQVCRLVSAQVAGSPAVGSYSTSWSDSDAANGLQGNFNKFFSLTYRLAKLFERPS